MKTSNCLAIQKINQRSKQVKALLYSNSKSLIVLREADQSLYGGSIIALDSDPEHYIDLIDQKFPKVYYKYTLYIFTSLFVNLV